MTQQCDYCDFPAVHIIEDATSGQVHLCETCRAEIDEANAAYQSKPRTINWGAIFNEDPATTLNTFYSGVEA